MFDLRSGQWVVSCVVAVFRGLGPSYDWGGSGVVALGTVTVPWAAGEAVCSSWPLRLDMALARLLDLWVFFLEILPLLDGNEERDDMLASKEI